jgi:uncharacterized protein YjbI with pentapeptide repeats
VRIKLSICRKSKAILDPILATSRIFAAIMLSSVAFVISAAAQNGAAGSGWTENEAYVLQQTAAKHDADFSKRPSRNLSANFVERLLSGKISALGGRQTGVAILHAHIVGDLQLSHTEVGLEAILNDCEFEGTVDISGSHFRYDLSLEGAHFKKSVLAGNLKVEGTLNLKGSSADEEFDWGSVHVGESLYVQDLKINCSSYSADFDYSKIAGVADFTGVKGPIVLTGADLQVLMLGGNTVPSEVDEVDLDGAIILGDLTIKNATLRTLKASGLHVYGRTFFQNVKITENADLTNSRFQELNFLDAVEWPDEKSAFRLDGISFTGINPGDDYDRNAPRWKWLLESWVDRSKFSPEAYQQLEVAFKNSGMIDLSNETFEHMKSREKDEGNLSWLGRHWNSFLRFLIGYGREPQYAVGWSILVVAFGYFVFRPRYMTARKPDEAPIPYNAFWYSVGLFLPLSTLLASDAWIPKPEESLRRNYARIHSILGWILIPFGVAALTGLVSGK